MSHDDRNNDEKQRDKILQKYGLQFTGASDLADIALDMATDAKILKEIANRQTDDDDDDDEREDDDEHGERRGRDDD